MRSTLLQPWTTIRADAASVTSIVQDVETWLEMAGAQDATFWIDVRVVTLPAAATHVYLSLESSPTRDESCFAAVAPKATLAASTSPTVLKTVMSASTGQLARYLRWHLTTDGTTGTWDVTFRVRVATSGTAFFSPVRLSGCVLWLRGDLGITLNGTTVSAWADQSGSGHDATQATGANQPTYTLSAMNGLPALLANGTKGGMATASFSLGGPLSMFAAVQPSSSTQGTYARLLETKFSNGYFLGTDAAGTGYKVFINDPGISGTIAAGTVTSGVNTLATMVCDNIANSGTLYVYTPSAAASNSASVTPPSSQSQATAVMQDFQLNQTSVWNGYMAEVIVYNRALTANELLVVHRYLGSRYAVSTVP